MEMTVFFYWFVVSCFVIVTVPNADSKTVSLNELIAAESRKAKSRNNQGKKSLEHNHLYTSRSKEDNTDTHTARLSSKEVVPAKTKLTNSKVKSSAIVKKLTGSPAKPLLKKSLLRGIKGPNKFKGILSDLETEASDIIKVLRNKKASTNKYSEEVKSGKPDKAEQLSLNRLFFRDPKKPREFQITELITPRGKKLLSSLKYRKKFQIKSPLKAKKVRLPRSRQKRKNQSVKRQANYGRFDRQYIPLLRSLSLLFDNVLSSGSGENEKRPREDDDEENMDMASESSNIIRSDGKPIQINKGNWQANTPFSRNRTTYRSRNETDDKSGEDDRSNENKRLHERFRNKQNTSTTETIRNIESFTNDEGNRTKGVNSEESPNETSGSNEQKVQKKVLCSCATKTDAETEESEAREKATAPTAILKISNETIQIKAATAATNHTSNGNLSSIRQDTDVPILSPGNTTSTRRDLIGLSEGSGPAFHRSVEGNITGDHRDSKHNSRSGEDKSDAKDDEKDTDSLTRDSANGSRSAGRVRGDSDKVRSPVYRGGSYEIEETQVIEEIDTKPGRVTQEAQVTEEIVAGPIGHAGFEGEVNIKTGGDEAESATVIPESIRQLGGRVGKDRVGNHTESVQSKEDHEESFNGLNEPLASNKRITVGDGASPSETEETSSADETTITREDLADPIKMLRATPKGKAPYVTIIDGYSEAKNINGKNKLSEHSIRFHA